MKRGFVLRGCIFTLSLFLTFPTLTFASVFKMKDGSFLKGELREEVIKVKASLGTGEMTLNAKDIVSILVSEKMEIRLRDGSLIKGEIIGETLKVKTSFGEFPIDVQQLARYEGSVPTGAPEPAKPAPQGAAIPEKAKGEEEGALKGEALEFKTYDRPFNTLWQGVTSTLNSMGEKTDKVSKDEGKITTKVKEFTDSKALAGGGYEPGDVKYGLQVFVISLAEGKTKVALHASFEKKKMKLLSKDIEFPEGLKVLRLNFYENLDKAVMP